jgi:rhamnose transport system ATP-binding protein
MADRVLVVSEGRLVDDIPRARADEDSVMLAATGQGSSIAAVTR